MGAWIEIVRVYGLKLVLSVAPFVGAWIEIKEKQQKPAGKKVAPFVGAWIEIMNTTIRRSQQKRRSLRGSVD